jgi:hypothetical protein
MENYSSLGFRKRAAITDVTATPDYLQTIDSKYRDYYPTRKASLLRSKEKFSSKNDKLYTRSNYKTVASKSETKSSIKASVNREDVPLIVNPEFDGGNRFTFRRKMHQLKEEVRGQSSKRLYTKSTEVKSNFSKKSKISKPYLETTSKATTTKSYRELKVGVRASGFKVFKTKETMSGLEKNQEKVARPAFKARAFKSRFKKK